MAERTGNWIQTFTGKQFFPLDPRVEDINIVDIAHALSMSCRYTGHCTRFYSVAEHSVRVSENVPKELALEALLHDASEAYLTDIPRPIKPYIPQYKEMEERVERVIAQVFGTGFPMNPLVKEIDNRILADEKAQLMAPCEGEWILYGEPLGNQDDMGWKPGYAKMMFLDRFYELTA
jgi:hypothetical protein